MKFKKIVSVGISESALDPNYWSQVDALCEKRVSLTEDSPVIATELKDAGLPIGFFQRR